MNIKRALLALGAMLLSANLFGASPAFAAEGYQILTQDIGNGVLCQARTGGQLWPVDGISVPDSRFYYCGTSTASSRGYEVYNPLKGISNGEPSISTLMTSKTVRVYVMDSPIQYATATGKNPQTVWTTQANTPAFSLFTADGDPENAIIIYERVPDTALGYPALKANPVTLQNHDVRHELGHHFDRHNGTLSNKPIFINLKLDDVAYEVTYNPNHSTDVMLYNYWWGSNSELFAEQFAIATGSSARNPLDQKTSLYFKCTYRYTNNWKMNQANPPGGTYATHCSP